MNNTIVKEKFYVSHTKLDTYKTCPMMYNYKYIMRLDKKISRRSFYVGEDIHKLIELFYLHRTPHLLQKRITAYEEHLTKEPDVTGQDTLEVNANDFKEAHDKWQKKAIDLYSETLTWRKYIEKVISPRVSAEGDGVKAEIGYNYINDIIKIMGQYEYYYSNDNIKVLDLEHKKYSVMGEYNGKEVVLTYISDGVLEVNGEQFLIEHKTFSSEAMSFEETWLNVQTAEYVTALNKEGWNIKGVIWDSVKSKAPEDPNILKSGAYGKQSQARSLFSLISTDIIMRGTDAVIEVAQQVASEANSIGIFNNYQFFLSRHTTRFNDEAVKSIRKDSDSVIEVITREEVPMYRNMGWSSCRFCDFKDLCQLEMLGHETQSIINTLYNKKENNK